MVLVLSVLRCPDQAVPEQRRVPGGEYVMGRGSECDWPLLDPDRVLSKRHCAVEYFSGGWQVRDLSTNGTFVNSSGDPVGREQTRALRDGDRLRIGSYEIECRVEEEAGWGAGQWQSAQATPDPMAPPAQAGDDIFSAPLPGLSPAGGPMRGSAPLLPADFDPLGDDDAGPAMPDHRPSTNDVFTPPRATMPDLLPGDWDAPIAPPAARGGDPFGSLPDPFADAPPGAPPRTPAADPFAAMPDPFAAPRPAPVRAAPLPDPFADMAPAAPRSAPLPDPFAAPAAPRAAPLPDPFADLAPPAAPGPPPALPAAALPDPFADLAPPAAPRARPVADPFAEPGDPFAAASPKRAAVADPFAEAGDPPPAAVAMPVAVPAAPVQAAPAAPPQAAPAASLDQALALLMKGAGLPAPPPGTDAAAALVAAGVALRASVGGLRALLIARADVKREFRIEQTMLRAAGNNPIKFAATEEMAIQALLGPRGNGPAAVEETVGDLTAHQVATVAATQAAAKALLARLAPAGVEADIPGGGIMPGAREKRLWEAYRKLHQQVTDQFEDDFDSAFGKAFARAYEDASRANKA